MGEADVLFVPPADGPDGVEGAVGAFDDGRIADEAVAEGALKDGVAAVDVPEAVAVARDGEFEAGFSIAGEIGEDEDLGVLGDVRGEGCGQGEGQETHGVMLPGGISMKSSYGVGVCE